MQSSQRRRSDVRDLKLPALHRLVELRHEALALLVLGDTQMGVHHQLRCGPFRDARTPPAPDCHLAPPRKRPGCPTWAKLRRTHAKHSLPSCPNNRYWRGREQMPFPFLERSAFRRPALLGAISTPARESPLVIGFGAA